MPSGPHVYQQSKEPPAPVGLCLRLLLVVVLVPVVRVVVIEEEVPRRRGCPIPRPSPGRSLYGTGEGLSRVRFQPGVFVFRTQRKGEGSYARPTGRGSGNASGTGDGLRDPE